MAIIVLQSAWLALKERGVGGGQPPRICKQNDPHGDDLMLIFSDLKKAGGMGGAAPPPFANKMIRTAFP